MNIISTKAYVLGLLAIASPLELQECKSNMLWCVFISVFYLYTTVKSVKGELTFIYM